MRKPIQAIAPVMYVRDNEDKMNNAQLGNAAQKKAQSVNQIPSTSEEIKLAARL
jgi:hypothetical protein